MKTVRARNRLAPWVEYTRSAKGRLVLLCLPHAGGAASTYRGWATKLGDHGIDVWPVQLPGRESRFIEPLTTDLDHVTGALTDLVRQRLGDRPYAVYGHSAGALLAYRFTLVAEREGNGPCHLFLGACRPPNRPDPDFPLHRLDRDRFLDRLLGYGRIPREVLAYPDMVDTMIDTARADLEMVEAPLWTPNMVVHCPVTALGGASDATVPVDTLPYWRDLTAGGFERVVLPGGHFPSSPVERHLLEVIRRGVS